MVIPLRSGRQNHPLGLGESGRRQGRGFSGVAARPRAVTTVAPLRHQAGGAGSRRSRQPRTMTLPLNSQPKARPFCDHRRCRVWRPGSRACRLLGLQHAADNGLVAGSSPPGPTTQSCANPEFPVSADNEDRPEADWGPSSLTFRNPFPGAPGQRLREVGCGAEIGAPLEAEGYRVMTCRFRRKPPLIPG